ncbi:GNAT family N-acetyltransferase [Flavobacterium sp. RHBU_24]|uniref:GNAT family N-acetyltransferase n=1 Tax=Flavobacterium sp. RHBU_24 TaxID=3391185 RepID=UPI003985402C
MHLQSSRLYYRELLPTDDVHMFALDSLPEVHTYLYDPVVSDIRQSRDVIAYVRSQYTERGIGRMAALIKGTDEFIGWVGLKLERDINGRGQFYDIGYRLMPQYWGKGYATEATLFFLDYAFNVLGAEEVNAFAFPTNGASLRVLEKCGLKQVETFTYNGQESVWLEIKRPTEP